ncbi:MAG: ABC transporter permease [Alistipes sp.]|nr:ABC transporter permease [Alistipes sp.]
MRRFATAFRVELKRIVNDRAYLAIITVLPAVALLFFYCYFSGSGVEQLPIVVVDNSSSSLSERLVNMIDATRSVSVDYKATDQSEAMALINSGKAYAAVVIPADFERNILRGEQAVVALYNSGANISTNGFIEKDIATVVATFSAGIELNRGRTMAQIMPIRLNRRVLFNPYLNYGYYLAPCFMPMMVMIFTVLATVMATAERRTESLAQLMGRVAPTTIAMSIFAILMLLIIFRAIGTPLRGSATMIVAATLLLIAVYQTVALLFVGVTHSRHLALSLGGGYSVVAFTLSGLTFPTMAMALPLRALSYLFPFTYYMEIVVDQALRGASWEVSMARIGYMSLFLLLPALIYRRL